MTSQIRETEVEGPARDYAKSRGWYADKIMRTGRRGFPDHFFLRQGRVILIEFKRPGEVPEPHQLKRHREIREHGGEVFVVDSLEVAREILF